MGFEKRISAVAAFIFLFVATVFAQSQVRTDAPAVFSGTVRDSVSNEVLSGAVVSLVSGTDTLWTTAAKDGSFTISSGKLSKYTLNVHFLGYEKWTRQVGVLDEKANINVNVLLVPSSDEIEKAVLKEDMTVMTERGDTVVFNVAPLPRMRGDMAGDLIGRLPGIEVSDYGITAMGKTVAKVLVNKTGLFGKDPVAAMKNLEAKEVRQVEVYDYTRSTDEFNTETIMNIITEHPLDKVINAELLASAAVNGKKGKESFRYGAGGDLNYFSNPRIFNVSLSADDMNLQSNSAKDINKNLESYSGYEEKQAAGVHYEENINNIFRIDADYDFLHSYKKLSNIEDCIYFPTEMFDERITKDSTYNSRAETTHEANLSLSYTGPVSVSSYTDFRISGASEQNANSTFSFMDGKRTGAAVLSSPENSKSCNLSEKLILGIVSTDATALDASFDLKIDNDGSDGFKIDTSDVSSSPLNQIISGKSRKQSYKAGLSFDQKLVKRLYLDLSYDFSYIKGHELRLSESRITGLIDSTDVYNHNLNDMSHTASATLRYRIGKVSLNAGAAGMFTRKVKDDFFFSENAYERWFSNILPSAGLILIFPNRLNFNLIYKTSPNIPSLNMLSRNVSSFTPLKIMTGNPNLNSPATHSIYASLNKTDVKKNYNLIASVAFSYNPDHIGQSSMFYAEEAVSSDGNFEYTIPAGATVTSFENMGKSMKALAEIKYSAHVKQIKSKLDLNFKFNYNHEPYMNQGVRYVTENMAPSVRISWQSNFSRFVRCDISVLSVFDFSSGAANVGLFSQGVLARLKFSFLKDGYAAVDYTGRFLIPLKGLQNRIFSNFLNAKVGWLVSGNWNICLAATDILNRNNNVSRKILSDHSVYQWENSFGRCISLSVGYRFSHTKKADLSDIDFE